MSSPAHADFLAAWRDRDQREIATLVKIELTRPSPQTIYLSAGKDVVTPGGTPQGWQGGMIGDIEPLDFPGSLRESSWSPATGGFTLINGQFIFQSGTDKVRDAFTDFGWIGAAVTFYLWPTTLTDFTKALAFKGFRVQSYELERWVVTVRVIQRWNWNREIELKQATRKLYPRIPDENVGRFIPKIRGKVLSVGHRAPWTAEFGPDQHTWEHLTGGRRATPGIMVDRGGGDSAEPSKVLFASHKCHTFYHLDGGGFPDRGSLPYLSVDGILTLFDAASTDAFNATDGTGIKIGDVSGGTDPYAIAFYPLRPINTELYGANDADNVRAVLDIESEHTYARLDYNAGKRQLKVRLPNVSPLGDPITVYYAFGYRSDAATANLLTLAVQRGGVGIVGAGNNGSTVPITGSQNVAGTDWDFSDEIIEIYFNGVQTGHTADIFFIGAIVKFKPKIAVVGDPNVPQARIIPRRFQELPRERVQNIPGIVPTNKNFPAGVWFATLAGYMDDGEFSSAGDFTGTGSALIEKAPDIVQHLLFLEGGEPLASIERGASTFGSLVDARANLKTWRQSDMVHAIIHTERERVARVLDLLCDDAGIWCYLGEYDDKWKCIVWRERSDADYDLTIGFRRIGEPGLRLRPTPGTRRTTALDVPYSFDYFKNQSIFQVGLGPDRSAGGHGAFDIRDQLLTVSASGEQQNNKLDFKTGGVDYTATLTTGDYASGIAAAQDIATKMNAAHASDWIAGYGPHVAAGFNDTIRFDADGTVTTVTIPPGNYATMEALGVAVAAVLNAPPTITPNWTCTYSRTTRKFTITRSAGPINIYWGSGAVATKKAMALLGFKDVDSVGPATADYEREEERFHIGNLSTAFDLKWRSGTNGTENGNVNCSELFGFDGTKDDLSTGATDVSFMGYAPKNLREQAVADVTTVLEGESSPRSVRGDTIYDDDTAREVADRMADLFLVDRPTIDLPLLDCPDIERGRVFALDATVDAQWPYAVEGSDGSWVGKRFQVVSKRQHLAGSFLTEVTAVEVS